MQDRPRTGSMRVILPGTGGLLTIGEDLMVVRIGETVDVVTG